MSWIPVEQGQTVSDPAIEAAQSALDQRPWFGYGQDEQLALIAARETLEPIRELHRQDGDYCWSCDHTSWPCPTAKLIYSTEELGEGKP